MTSVLLILVFVLGALVPPAVAGPLSEAVKDGDIAQVRLLLAQGEDVNEFDFDVGTPLHVAAVWGNREMAELLLTEGADPTINDPTFGTPLNMAAFKGNEAAVVALIAYGADTEARNRDGTTPLHTAAGEGYAEVVQLLVENGANINARSTRTSARIDFAPIYSAGLNGHFDIVDLLRALGAKGPKVEPVSGLLASADPLMGEKYFKSYCRSCHTIEKGNAAGMFGPNLWGVLGRKKASFEGSQYSPAFKRLVGIWTIAEFNAFITSPVDYVPGTAMDLSSVENPMDRANLVAFMRQMSDDPPSLPPVANK